MALVYSEAVVHSSIFFLKLQNHEKLLRLALMV